MPRRPKNQLSQVQIGACRLNAKINQTLNAGPSAKLNLPLATMARANCRNAVANRRANCFSPGKLGSVARITIFHLVRSPHTSSLPRRRLHAKLNKTGVGWIAARSSE
jgi:hypothetical protein